MRTKILAIMMAILLLLAGGLTPSCAAETLAEEEAVAFLNALGIMEGREEGDFDAESVITRAEMTTVILRLLGVETSAGGKDIFTDVTTNHWAYDEIGAAYAMGIVNGVGENLFMPDGALSFEAATKMVVSLLGYGVKAEAAGGYPTGYLSQATQLDILTGVSGGEGGVFRRGDVARLVANALEVPLFSRVSFGGDAYRFTEDENVTLLTEYLKIGTEKGDVTASYEVSVSGTNVDKDKIELSGEIFGVGKTDIAKSVGKAVKAYYRTENDEKTILFYKNVKSEAVIKIYNEEIDGETAETRVVYTPEDADKKESISLTDETRVVLNGRPLSPWTRTDLMPEFGSLTVITKDGLTAKTVLIQSYENRIVDRVNTGTETVYFKAEKENSILEMDLEGSNPRMVLLDTDGNSAGIDRIGEWDVISIAESRDKSLKTLIWSSARISGTVEELGNNEATIDGITLKIAESLSKNDELVEPTLGEIGSACLDFDGRIAAFYKGGTSAKYGYLVAGEYTKGITKRAQLKLFTEDNIMQVFDTQDYVTVISESGQEVVKTENLLDEAYGLCKSGLEGGKENIEVNEQLLMYRLSAGKIAHVELAQDAAGMTEAEADTLFTVDEKSKSAYYLPGNMRVFLSRYMVSDSTKIFNVPSKYKGDDKAYSILPADKLTQKYYSDLEFYDIREDNTISAFVTHETVSTASIDSRADIGVVTKLSKGLNEEGEEIVNITVYGRTSGEKSMFMDPGLEVLFGTGVITDKTKDPCVLEGVPKEFVTPMDIEVGDVVQFVPLASGEAATVALRFRYGTPIYRDMGAKDNKIVEREQGSFKNLAYEDCYILFGKVLVASNEAIKTHVKSPDGKEDWVRAIGYNSMTLRLFDTKNATISTITPQDILADDEIFVYRWTQNNGMIVVYR